MLMFLFPFLSVSAQKQPTAPDFLKPGDSIALLSPASVPEVDFVTASENVLHRWGYQTVRGEHVLDSLHGSFAGTKEERKSDLLAALQNPKIKAIFCIRGGYGAVQEMQEIPLDTVAKYPKWIIGYSDITVLHSAWVSSGVQSIHAHMGEHLLRTDGKDTCSVVMKNLLSGKLPKYIIPTDTLNVLGEATGTLIGGNLSVYCGVAGTYLDGLQKIENPVLFIEDVEESFEHVDRYCNFLKLNGTLNKLKAVIIGQFTHYDHNGDYPSMDFVFRQYFNNLGIPVIYNFPVGHVTLNFPLIVGAKVHVKVGKEESSVYF